MENVQLREAASPPNPQCGGCCLLVLTPFQSIKDLGHQSSTSKSELGCSSFDVETLPFPWIDHEESPKPKTRRNYSQEYKIFG